MYAVMTNKNTSTHKPNLEERKRVALLAVNSIGRTRTHGPSFIQERRNATLERINENGRGTRSHGKREMQPQTKKDLSKFKIGGLAVGLAISGAALMSGGEDAPKTPDKAPTTVVIAKEGDSIWKLQEKEGFNGNKPYEVVQEAVELNGTSKIFPGQEVVLVNDPNTNPTNSQP